MQGGLGLEEKFAYSVYDFLEDMREKSREVNHYVLERIAKEHNILGEKLHTRKFIIEAIKGEHKRIMKRIEYYLMTFYKENNHSNG